MKNFGHVLLHLQLLGSGQKSVWSNSEAIQMLADGLFEVSECLEEFLPLRDDSRGGTDGPYEKAGGFQLIEYGPVEEAEDGEEDWVDRHSINCIRCGALTDERFAFRTTSNEGMICATCKFEKRW